VVVVLDKLFFYGSSWNIFFYTWFYAYHYLFKKEINTKKYKTRNAPPDFSYDLAPYKATRKFICKKCKTVYYIAAFAINCCASAPLRPGDFIVYDTKYSGKTNIKNVFGSKDLEIK